MSARLLLVAGALAAAAVLAPTIAAAAKDDPAARQAGRDALKKELKEKKFFVYFDLSYYVDAPKLKESRWDWRDPPPFSPVSEEGGAQFYAEWVPSAGGEAGIKFLAEKMPHYKMEGAQKTVYNHEFKSWGKSVLVSKIDDMAKGFYEDWLRESTEPLKAPRTEPKKLQVGPSEWYASAVATDKNEKKRIRRDWYVWGTGGPGIPCTWIATVTISDKFKDVDEVVQRSIDMMKNTIEIKDKRAR